MENRDLIREYIGLALSVLDKREDMQVESRLKEIRTTLGMSHEAIVEESKKILTQTQAHD